MITNKYDHVLYQMGITQYEKNCRLHNITALFTSDFRTQENVVLVKRDNVEYKIRFDQFFNMSTAIDRVSIITRMLFRIPKELWL